MRNDVDGGALGLATSALWGCGDFLGGYSSRKAHTAHVGWVAAATGLAAFTVLAMALAEPLPSTRTVGTALVAGLAGGAGLLVFYRALATGRMGIVAPVTAVTFASIPVLYTAAGEGLPSPVQAAGFALACVGIAIVCWTPGPAGLQRRATWRSVRQAVASGCFFGTFVILLDASGDGGFLWPLAAAKLSSGVVPLAWVLGARIPTEGLRAVAPTAVGAGVLDAGGNAFLLAAGMAGRLDVAVVLGSFYPAVTLLLARFVLGERLRAAQLAGAVAMLLAVPLVLWRQ